MDIQEDGHVKRGCLRDLDPETKSFCNQNTDICKTCFGSNCNRRGEFVRCYDCNSKDDMNCSGNSSLGNSVVCKSYYGVCVTAIDAHGYTHRRCGYAHWSEDDGLIAHHKMQTCMTMNCNSVVYPSDRLQCYHCNGEDECNFMASGGALDNSFGPMPCGRISEPEQCYTYLSEGRTEINTFSFPFSVCFSLIKINVQSIQDNKMYRGCLADNDKYRALCDEDSPDKKGTCIKCSESGCNNIPKVKSASLSCVQCNKSEECAFGHEETTPCESEIPFGSEEFCYTHFNAGKENEETMI